MGMYKGTGRLLELNTAESAQRLLRRQGFDVSITLYEY